MKPIITWAFVAISLAGCQSVRQAQTVPEKVAIIRTETDKAVAATAEALKAACFAARIGIDLTSTFTKNARLISALAKARVAVDSYCSGPTPQDVAGALEAVTAAYRAVMAAAPQVAALMEVEHASSHQWLMHR